jgi:hypothetical protein
VKSRDELDISDEPQGMIRSAITPQPLVALVFCAVVFLIFAIFVFGARGKYPDVDISDFLRTLAVGALAAAITTIIDRQVTFRHLSRSIESSLRSAAGVARSIDELGIQAVHKRFDYGLIFREARRGETVSWLDTYCPRQNEFVDDIIDCLQRSVHVRMLTIEPGCQNERFRNLELESTVDTGGGWDAGLAAFISKMKAISAKEGGNI